MGCGCREVNPRYIVPPSEEQQAKTWGTNGYFPGATCKIPEDCKHITSYNDLKDKPTINKLVLQDNLTAEQLGLQRTMRTISNAEIEEMFTKK